MLQGRCKKCGLLIRTRQGKLSRQEVIEKLKKMKLLSALVIMLNCAPLIPTFGMLMSLKK